MAHNAGYTAISSHRSGETADTTIADLAVALNTCQIRPVHPADQSVLLNIISFSASRNSLATVPFIPEWQLSISKNKNILAIADLALLINNRIYAKLKNARFV